MADALTPLLKEYNDAIERYSLLPKKKYRNILHKSSTALRNYLLEMSQDYENMKAWHPLKVAISLVDDVDNGTKDLMDSIYLEGTTDLVEGFFRSRKRNIIEIIGKCGKLCNIKYSCKSDQGNPFYPRKKYTGSNIEQGEEVVVGFDEEVVTLLDQLTSTSIKQFQVISIAGMAGLGKTTLARKLYNHPLVEYFFDIRAWTSLSQVYVVKDLILNVLSSFIHEVTDKIYKMDDKQLGEKLYRLRTKGPWYFPDDKTGSRVLFTSRDIDICSHVQAGRPTHILRFRNEVESWDLFQKKTFSIGLCPLSLKAFGRAITRKCGLPLAIVIASGLLKDNMSKDWWSHIAKQLSLFMVVSNPSKYMDSLALSYNILPPHLKPCFLFFGSFPEDYEVPVRKLMWLWIAQGFVHKSGSKILENVAGDFLMDLINRGLVMTSKKRADGRIKTCRIHDLLRDFCLRKAKEEKFGLLSYNYALVQQSSSTAIHSGLCYPYDLADILQKGRIVHNETYKYLRVLDMEYVPISVFHYDVDHLADLRYLAIQGHDGSLPPSLSSLVKLQTLIISSKKNVLLPETIWNMVTLRHILIKSGENLIEEPKLVQVPENDGSTNLLPILQTLSQVSPQSCQNVSTSTPNLRKLGFCGPLISSLGDLEYPNVRSLQHLEKLKLLNTISYPEATRSCNPLRFPGNLKKLTLCNIGMDWDEMWTFAWVPNLEVLKLKFQACIGESWETGEVEFRRLQVLKLHDLDLTNWDSSRKNFPRLQRLVVHRCSKLKSIPLDIGRILTLETIEVRACRNSAHNSAIEIQKEQESEGNFFLKVHAKPDLEIQKEQ